MSKNHLAGSQYNERSERSLTGGIALGLDHLKSKRSFRTRRTHKNEKFYYFLRTEVQNQTHAGTVAGCHL